MNEFEEKKKQYYDRISSYDINSKFNFHGFDKGYNLVRTLLNPRTKVEMDFGEAVFQLLDDISKINKKLFFSSNLDYDEDNNEFIRYFSDYASKVLNGQSLKNKLFLIDFNEKNEMFIDINGSALNGIFMDNPSQYNFDYDYYAKVFYDMFYATSCSDVLLCALSRNNINVSSNSELFKNLLSQSISNANGQVQDNSLEAFDINRVMVFFTNLFNSFHHIAEEKMKLERKNS